jgi:DNA-binding CsgD family transcriptional regulator
MPRNAATALAEEAPGSLEAIVLQRHLPGLMVLDAAGRIRLSNRRAREILERSGDTLKERLGRDLTRALRKATGQRGTAERGELLLRETFTSDRRCYVLQAFVLEGDVPEVAVLLERINPTRFNITRARRLFNFSPREMEIISSLLLAMADKEIAVALGISPETVRGYMKTIRTKLGVSTRSAIITRLLAL